MISRSAGARCRALLRDPHVLHGRSKQLVSSSERLSEAAAVELGLLALAAPGTDLDLEVLRRERRLLRVRLDGDVDLGVCQGLGHRIVDLLLQALLPERSELPTFGRLLLAGLLDLEVDRGGDVVGEDRLTLVVRGEQVGALEVLAAVEVRGRDVVLELTRDRSGHDAGDLIGIEHRILLGVVDQDLLDLLVDRRSDLLVGHAARVEPRVDERTDADEEREDREGLEPPGGGALLGRLLDLLVDALEVLRDSGPEGLEVRLDLVDLLLELTRRDLSVRRLGLGLGGIRLGLVELGTQLRERVRDRVGQERVRGPVLGLLLDLLDLVGVSGRRQGFLLPLGDLVEHGLEGRIELVHFSNSSNQQWYPSKVSQPNSDTVPDPMVTTTCRDPECRRVTWYILDIPPHSPAFHMDGRGTFYDELIL